MDDGKKRIEGKRLYADDFAELSGSCLEKEYAGAEMITKVRELIFLNAHEKSTVGEVDKIAIETFCKMEELFKKSKDR